MPTPLIPSTMFSKPRSVALPFRRDGDEIVVRVPASSLAYLTDSSNPNIYWTAIGGVIQLTGSKAVLTVPVSPLLKEHFVAQP